MIVTVDGNVGAGKSTALALLAAEGLDVSPEPVADWQEQLERTYLAPPALRAHETLRLQLRVFADRCLPPPETGRTCVFERSPFFQLRTFIPVNARLGHLSAADVALFERLYHDALARWPPEHLYIYLRCEPDLCFTRISSRHRPGEEGLSRDYIRALHERHEGAARELHAAGATLIVVPVGAGDTPADVAARVREAITLVADAAV